jgi:hypothetical protein
MSMPPQQRPPDWQQGPWPPQPPPPLPDFAPDKKNAVKWLLIAVAVLLVIGVTVVATLFFTRDSGGGTSAASSSAVPSDIASADDTGPVTVVTEEPTCDALYGINSSLATIQGNGWGDQRGTLGPVSEWTTEQHTQVQGVATAIRNAADQMVALAKQTPHRVVRELYEQYIAYGRAYADSIPHYTPSDNLLASANVNISNVLFGICNSIRYKSAGRSLGLEAVMPPTKVGDVGEPGSQERFISSSNSSCSAWTSKGNKFLGDLTAWQAADSNVPGPQWTPEQRAVQLAAFPIIETFANDIESTGRQSGNPVFEDVAVLGALYFRAYVSAGEGYSAADSWLAYTGLRVNNAISDACQAAGS